MQTVLIVIHLMVVVALVVVVLLQRSEGGALGIGSSGTGGLFTGRGQANALTRATTVLGAIFFATSIALTLLASFNRGPKSIFEGQGPQPAGQTAPALPGGTPGGSVLDDLKRMQESVPPNAPAQPAPAAPNSR